MYASLRLVYYQQRLLVIANLLLQLVFVLWFLLCVEIPCVPPAVLLKKQRIIILREDQSKCFCMYKVNYLRGSALLIHEGKGLIKDMRG